MRVSELSRNVVSHLLDLVYPRNCVWCERAVEATSPYRYLSLEAAQQLQPIVEPRCSRCGATFYGETESKHGCGACENEAFHFDQVRCAYRYTGPARSMVKALKYMDGVYMKDDIRLAIRNAPDFLSFFEGAVCVPVPITDKKREQRGYNQAELIVDCIMQHKVEKSSAQEALIRTKDQDTQTFLSKTDRRRNVARSFAINPNVIIDPDTRYVIVDDVFTTGATASACAATLKAAGALRVDVATFSRG
ncbi:MAG: double zinc ribbon domain-containing protein [Opitutales bacterium]